MSDQAGGEEWSWCWGGGGVYVYVGKEGLRRVSGE